MKLIVTGGCGHIGVHITSLLAARGLEVISVHRSPSHHRADVTCIQADFKSVPEMSECLTGTDVLIHLASQSVPRTSVDLGVPGILSEVDANGRLFDLAVKARVSRIVFASSGGSVYGDCEPGKVISEDHPLRPISPHGLLKAMTEMALAHVARMSGVSAVSLRPGNVYGPSQQLGPRYGIVPTFLNNLKLGKPCEIWGPESVRDYVHVDDAAQAFVNAALTPNELPREIHVATRVGHTALEVYAILQALTGLDQPVLVRARPPADPAWSVLSSARMVESLDVQPFVDSTRGWPGCWAEDSRQAGHVCEVRQKPWV